MTQGKCNLLKPVDSLTGTFFMFSQYTQDLTKQYTQCDKWRCIPSKFAALHLNIGDKDARKLGEIFQNYFENACTFMRSLDEYEWKPEDARVLLFQTLQKFDLMKVEKDVIVDEEGVVRNGVSQQLQFIGDINIYSYEELKDGTGYNEIYCYIPNDAKAKDYQLSAIEEKDIYAQALPVPEGGAPYMISGYQGQKSYNKLSWELNGYTDDNTTDASKVYCIGKYDHDLSKYALIPQILDNHNESFGESSNDAVRKDGENELTSFSVNAIVVFYDIVSKNGAENDQVLHYNVPLGIYFTGAPVDGKLTNEITKYISSDEIYNQGTSYGLRICSRFLSHPNSTDDAVEVSATGSTNISELAPVLEKMGETLSSIQDVLAQDDKMYHLVKDHLVMLKNNKVNVPYVRQVGNKKYWFVNGKNTGAIAEYEISSADDIIQKILSVLLQQIYTKPQINNILNNYISRDEFERADFATKQYVDGKFEELLQMLKVYLQGE